MRIGISSNGFRLKSVFATQFETAKWFCIYDTEAKTTEYYQNEFAKTSGEANTKLPMAMQNLKVHKLISNNFSPQSLEQLKELSIEVQVENKENVLLEKIVEGISQT